MTCEAAVPIGAVVEKLSGKRLALLGFDTDGAAAVASVLELAGAFCRCVPADSSSAQVLARSFDGGIVYLAANHQIDLKSLAAAGKPIVVAAYHSVLAQQIGNIRSHAVDCVAYPFSAEELSLRSSSMFAVSMPGHAAAAGPPVVLIADDDPSIRALVKATLSAKRMDCQVAEDGQAAIRITREISPSVLVLDVGMPGMDGFEVLSAVRNESATAGVRVLMLTGCEQEHDIVRAFGLGADDYLVKPFNPMELAARVLRLLRVPR